MADNNLTAETAYSNAEGSYGGSIEPPPPTPEKPPLPIPIDTSYKGVMRPPSTADFEGIAHGEESKPIANYAGYDSGAVASSVGSGAEVRSGTSYMDDAKSTVAGQLSSLLSSNNPYIKQAEQRSSEKSASRGLLNSTLAAQAGTTAAIESALPIAQQDASEYNKFGLQQQQGENTIAATKAEGIISGELAVQKAKISQTAQNIQNAFTARISGANEESKAWLQSIQQSHEAAMSSMTYAQNQVLQNQDISAKVAESVRTQSGQIMQNYMVAVENLMSDPDFLNLGPEAMNNAINQMQTLATNSIKFMGAASGIDMSAFLKYFGKTSIAT